MIFSITFSMSPSHVPPVMAFSNTVVFKIKLIVGFKDTFAVDIIAVHLVQDIGFTKEGYVIGDSCRSNGFSLRFHIFDE